MTIYAHGIQGRADLPVPLTAFYWAAAAVLVVSFVALALGWRRPVLAEWNRRDAARGNDGRGSRVLGVVVAVLGAVGFAMLVLVFAAAAFGTEVLNDNIAPIAVFVVWWIGIAACAGFLVDVWRIAHPVGWVLRRAGVPDARRELPQAVGVWLAVVGLFAFTWLELVYPTAANVRLLAALVGAWALCCAVGMARYGVERWLDQGEPFAVYSRVLHHLSPVTAERVSPGRWRVRMRRPVVPLTGLRPTPGTVPLVGLLIGSVSFDGLSRTLWWKQRVASATVELVDRGLEPRDAQLVFGSFGLVLMVLLAIGAFLGASALARIVGGLPRRTPWGSVADAFAPSLVPIALAYVVAHYFSYFWFQSQRLVPLASDPFGRGWDLFGTRGFDIDYGTLSSNAIWGVQIGAIVVGHVLGLVLAHDRALEVEAAADSAGVRGVRSQLPMLALMVLYTVGGLYFLSEGLNA